MTPEIEATDHNTRPARLQELAKLSLELARLVATNIAACDKLLTKLHQKNDQQINKALVVNPNTPTEILMKLAIAYPEELLTNPVWDLLLLSNPNFLTEMPAETLSSLLKIDEFKQKWGLFLLKHRQDKNFFTLLLTTHTSLWNQWRESDSTKKIDLSYIYLRKANLRGADLNRADLKSADFSGAYLNCANLENANLEGATLLAVELQEAKLMAANLAYADLIKANLLKANLMRTNLNNANLMWANLENTNLEKANLVGANLMKANLVGANLTGANLTGADLEGANLMGANLMGATLEKADLEGANLMGAKLKKALFVGDRPCLRALSSTHHKIERK